MFSATDNSNEVEIMQENEILRVFSQGLELSCLLVEDFYDLTFYPFIIIPFLALPLHSFELYSHFFVVYSPFSQPKLFSIMSILNYIHRSNTDLINFECQSLYSAISDTAKNCMTSSVIYWPLVVYRLLQMHL